MAWEYLNTKPFDERYRIAAKQLGDISDKTVLDLNCGGARFRNFIECKRYIGNDISQPFDKKGGKFWEFRHCADEDMDEPMDILCLFGYGGGEFTGQPLESKTEGESLIRLAKKYSPEYIVVEMVQKWEDDFKAMSKIKKELPYKEVLQKRIDIEPNKHYHDKRIITILGI